jgi:hypothetical protein
MSNTSRFVQCGIRGLIGAAALLAVAIGFSGRAEAYPQFQFSSGTNRCGQCHYSPGGGGLLTSWGRDEAGDTISLGGDGAFLHGAVPLPSALALGGDFRLAAIQNDVGSPQGPDFAVFPMQADVYGRVAIGEAWSVNLTLGMRGISRPVDGSFGGRLGALATDIMSREHYVMYRPSATGVYARIGRFFAPYGLRLAEHIYYVRRYTGFNLYQETYNLSGGYVADDWEAHVTAFAPVPPGMPEALAAVGPRLAGIVGYGELRLAKITALAAQMRLAFGSLESRFQGGVVAKAWAEKPKILFLGEADLIHQSFTGLGGTQNQFVSFLGAYLFPARGLMLGVAYERFQENLAVAGTGRNAFDFSLNFYPWAHFEVMLLGRYQMTGTGAPDGTGASLGMVQLHYYL